MSKIRLAGACALLGSIFIASRLIFDDVLLAQGARTAMGEFGPCETSGIIVSETGHLRSLITTPIVSSTISILSNATTTPKYPPDGRIPICFVTSQFATSTRNADKLFDVGEKVPKLARSPFIQFLAFTNMENLHAPGWKVIVKDFGLKYRRIITHSRWPKFQAHHDSTIQQMCAVVFYIDGIVVPKDSVTRFQNEAKRILYSQVQFSQLKHTRGRTIEDELHQILNVSKDIPENVEKTRAWLFAQPDFSSDIQLYENNQYGYAMSSEAYKKIADFFWEHYSQEEDSWRDQPLWAYCLHHFQTVPLDLPGRMLFLVDNQRKGIGGHMYSPEADNDAYKAARYIQRQKEGRMNILCTSEERHLQFGSYKIRCYDFAYWAKQCAPDVNITTGISIAEVISNHTEYDFDATIIIKSVPKNSLTLGVPGELGKVFIDIVDGYGLHEHKINPDFTVILQNNLHEERYPNHEHRVVKHWYNSYPADVERGEEDPEIIPAVKDPTPDILRLATVWNTAETETEGNCPSIDLLENVSYDCIEQEFDIEYWYANVTQKPNADDEVRSIMANPKLGRGKLYYNLFQQYDVLVALAKNNAYKLRYGNVQRIVSQMRSGVPVLVEVRGPVLKYFVEKYNYKCAFQRVYPDSDIWDFEEAVEQLKNPKLLRECQRHGLEIATEFSPNRIGRKFLRAVGYEGEIEC
ncbi:hypothetical protein IV203_015615 [Nitzschia inconspicua]|uniref:Uncharacterized protein n=1 Tax=Nitzschia inconspicua TaxID=303405 RepID=A0A9K3LDZ7_9STRA|nr:hypothetical protein IV203_015615 [Nitzschia inconspicua]